MRLDASLVALAVLLFATPPAAAAPRTHVVVIDAMKFGAVPQGIRAGDRIIWVNKDMFRHTVTARDGRFNVDLQPGQRKSAAVGKAGAIAVICRYHPGMRTAVRVTP